MPELPEVEVVKKSLKKRINKLKFTNVSIINKKLRYQKDIGYKTAVSVDTYYRRHEKVDPPAENFNNKKNPSKGLIMWKMMGGNSGHSWSKRLKTSLDVIQKKERLKKINTTLEAIQLGMVR